MVTTYIAGNMRDFMNIPGKGPITMGPHYNEDKYLMSFGSLVEGIEAKG